MRKVSSYKCPDCGRKFKKLNGWIRHVQEEHPNLIPENMTPTQYFYYLQTGKKEGKCVVCGKPTQWIEQSGKYTRLCGSQDCKDKLREKYSKNMIAKKGTDNLFADPEFQKKCLSNRKISGKVTWWDGGTFDYVGSYEKDWQLNVLSGFLQWPSCDWVIPSPHTYIYEYEGKQHFYIPDAYNVSMDTEFERKDDDNMHPKIQKVDRVKDQLKEKAVRASGRGYCKIAGKNNYAEFFNYLLSFKEKNSNKFDDKELKMEIGVGTESLSYIEAKQDEEYFYVSQNEGLSDLKPGNLVYNNVDLAIRSIQALTQNTKFIVYKVSNMPLLSTYSVDGEYEIKTPVDLRKYGTINIINASSVTWEWIERPIGINPYPVCESVSMEALESFMNDNNIALEAITNVDIAKEENIITKGVLKSTKWIQDFGLINTITGKIKSLFVRVKIKNQIISIKGIDNNRLIARINDTYGEKRLSNILERSYTWLSLYKYNAKQIKKADMKVNKLYTNEFFVIELIKLFKDLGERYKDVTYMKIAREIYKQSWLKKADDNDPGELDTSNLSLLSPEYVLKPWQMDFVKNYKRLKSRLNLNGYILAFDPGLGKTLTSIALATCLNKEKIYIICPNSLKENWAIEIRGYFPQYKNDEALWKKEVGIVGNKDFVITEDTKYLICNLEAISKFMPYADSSVDSMLIIDESQNFRNIKGTRTDELLKFAKALNCKDIIPCSGTPVKANPSEIVPCLALLDPTFNQRCGEIYSKCFNIDTLNAASIINNRFGNIMFRRTKAEIGSLPPKYEENMFVTTNNSDKYLVSTTNKLIQERFEKIYIKKIEKNKELRKKFIEEHNKYSMASREYKKLFEKNVINVVNTNKVMEPLADVEKDILETYMDTYVFPNVPQNKLKEFKKLYTNFIMMEKQSMGEAMGEILPKYRAQMFIDMYEQNKMKFINAILDNPKKVVIFSPFLEVVKYIYKDLKANGIGIVKITGEDKERINDILRFKEDDEIQVLIATSQTLGTGVTLTEANKLYFFGTPWRSTDYKQASDRIHRIGQTDPVTIYNVLLRTEGKNLSTRMQEILSWSDEMFNGLIDSGANADLTSLAVESYLTFSNKNTVFIGTDIDLDTIEFSVNKNHSFLAFDNEYSAISWALYKKLYSLKDRYREENNTEELEIGWDFINRKFYFNTDQVEKINKLIQDEAPVYLYKVSVKDSSLGKNEINATDSEDLMDALDIYEIVEIDCSRDTINEYGLQICDVNLYDDKDRMYSDLLEEIYKDGIRSTNVLDSQDAMILNLVENEGKLYKDIFIGKITSVDIDKLVNNETDINKMERMKLYTQSLFHMGSKTLSNFSNVMESVFNISSYTNELNINNTAFEIAQEALTFNNQNTDYLQSHNYDEVELTTENIDNYKYKYPSLNNVKINDRVSGTMIINTEYDDLVGFVTVEEQSIKKNDNNKMITYLEVIKEYRQQGIGDYLFNKAINDFKANHVVVNKDNERALNLYKKNNWVETSHTDDTYNLRPKSYVDSNPVMESTVLPKIKTERGMGTLSGFTHNNIWNSVIELGGKNYRYRVETIIIDKNDPTKIYADVRGDKYRLPGGSTELDACNIEQAENEVNEEALLNIKNIKDSGYRYFVDYKKPPLWQADLPIKYDGTYTEVYVALEDGVYKGKVEEVDKDESMHIHGRFFPLSKIKNILRPEHLAAYEEYLQSEGITISTESNKYIGNKSIIATEAKLTAKERNALKDSDFGLPSKRQYPLIDEVHIKDAISYFRYCKEFNRKELAQNIMKAIKEKNLDIEIGEKSLIRKYL